MAAALEAALTPTSACVGKDSNRLTISSVSRSKSRASMYASRAIRGRSKLSVGADDGFFISSLTFSAIFHGQCRSANSYAVCFAGQSAERLPKSLDFAETLALRADSI